jgi:hypothetical protein
LRGSGAVPVAVAALLSVGPAVTTVAQSVSVPFYTSGSISSRAWPAGQCPLCASNTPFSDPGACD